MKSALAQEYDFFLQSLVAARKSAGLTQQQLADKLGKPQSFVSKYECRERRIDAVEFVVIANHLSIDPCEIVRELKARLSDYPA